MNRICRTLTQSFSLSTRSSSLSERFPPQASNLLTATTRDDPTPSRGTQLPRAASLIVSSLGFIHDLREGVLEPDHVRGIPLDMDQYTRLFGTARIPTDRGCRMDVHGESRHIVVIRRGQFCAYRHLPYCVFPWTLDRLACRLF